MKNLPTKDEFAELLMNRIHQTGEKGKLIYQPDEFSLRKEGDRLAALFLDNAYKAYCAADDDARERVVKNWVRTWFSTSKVMPEEFEDIRPDLMPVVRSRSHFELTNLEFESRRLDALPCRVLGEHFGIGLVYDLPESMQFISQGTLDAWEVTINEALDAAMENLASLPAKFGRLRSDKGVYLSVTDDNYNSSRLLLTNVIQQLEVRGDRIVMVPNQGKLFVVAPSSPNGNRGTCRPQVQL